MLAIRMQRTGRSGHAQFRVIVQDARFSPKSGRVVAYLGSYNPHTKATTIDKDKASQYLTNGAQPSDRVAQLLKKEGVKLPAWVKAAPDKKRSIRNPDKLRRNRPAEETKPEPVEASTPAEPAEEAIADAPAETTETAVAEERVEAETPGEEQAEKTAETPSEETAEASDQELADSTKEK